MVTITIGIAVTETEIAEDLPLVETEGETAMGPLGTVRIAMTMDSSTDAELMADRTQGEAIGP